MSKLAILGGKPHVAAVKDPHWPDIAESDIEIAAQMMRRGELSYVGREGQVKALEEATKAYFGTRYAIATSTGTTALHSAYFGIGLTAGDEVLAPTYTFLATVMPIFVCNAVPVLVDADEWTGNLDPAQLERHITPHTKAIAVTHLNGFPVDMATVMAVARRHGLKVVEDCSHAHGALCNGQKVGTFGDAAVFSTQAKKLVTGGEGGLLVTNDSQVHQRAVMLGHFRDRCYDEVTDVDLQELAGTGFGLNYRMHPIGAVLAKGSLSRLDQTIATRRTNFEHLSRALDAIPGIQPPVMQPHMTQAVYYSYQPTYRPEQLDGLPIDVFTRAVAAEGVPISRPKSPPLHCEPAFRRADVGLRTYGHFGRGAGAYRSYREEDLPASGAYVRRALRLPSTYSQDVRPLLDSFAEAIEKVVRHAGQLHDLARTGDDPLARMGVLASRRVGPMYRTEGA